MKYVHSLSCIYSAVFLATFGFYNLVDSVKGFQLGIPRTVSIAVSTSTKTTTTTRGIVGISMLLKATNVENDNPTMNDDNQNKNQEKKKNKKKKKNKRKRNRIITCASTKELQEAVELHVQSHHVVAELGSQLRDVSTSICERCANAVLIDVERNFPKSNKGTRTSAMRLSHDDSHDFFTEKSIFLEIPQLDDWRQALEQGYERYGSIDVFVLDVNAIVGNDLEWTSLSILQQVEAIQQSINKRKGNDNDNDQEDNSKDFIMLVKSVGLHQFASRLVHGQRWRGAAEYKAIPPPHIIATVGVQQYRDTIPYTVQKGDFVLEVGCHFGTSTKLLYDQSQGSCIGVDVGPGIIQQAKDKYPEISFFVGDAWKTATLLRLQQEHYKAHPNDQNIGKIGFDVVYVDVGGLSGIDGINEAIQLVSSIRYALEPRCIVIKSKCMQQLSSKLVPYWQTRKQKSKE